MNTECTHCGGQIEFEEDSSGLDVPCPHCGQLTRLTVGLHKVSPQHAALAPKQSVLLRLLGRDDGGHNQSALSSKTALVFIAGACAGVILLALGAWAFRPHAPKRVEATTKRPGPPVSHPLGEDSFISVPSNLPTRTAARAGARLNVPRAERRKAATTSMNAHTSDTNPLTELEREYPALAPLRRQLEWFNGDPTAGQFWLMQQHPPTGLAAQGLYATRGQGEFYMPGSALARKALSDAAQQRKAEAETAKLAVAERQQSETLSNTVRFLKSRAASGSVAAQYDLALRYIDGRGVEAHSKEALRLLRAAAAAGHEAAAKKLKELEAAQARPPGQTNAPPATSSRDAK